MSIFVFFRTEMDEQKKKGLTDLSVCLTGRFLPFALRDEFRFRFS